MIRIVKEMLPVEKNLSRPRWFVEVKKGNDIWDAGNFASESEAINFKGELIKQGHR